jgi:hypothetical protein
MIVRLSLFILKNTIFMKPRTFFFSFCLTLITLKSSGQNLQFKGIEYLTPDTVKNKILGVINADKTGDPFFVIWDTDRDTTYLRLARYSISDRLFELIRNSNRFVTLSKNQAIPILIGSDLEFNTMFHKVKNKGKETEIMDVTDFNISGYAIEFTGTYYNAKLIKFEWFTF